MANDNQHAAGAQLSEKPAHMNVKVTRDTHHEMKVEMAHLGMNFAELIGIAWESYKEGHPQPWRAQAPKKRPEKSVA
jgi:hypothetical protein